MSKASLKAYFRTQIKTVPGGPAVGTVGSNRAAGILAALDKLVDALPEEATGTDAPALPEVATTGLYLVLTLASFGVQAKSSGKMEAGPADWHKDAQGNLVDETSKIQKAIDFGNASGRRTILIGNLLHKDDTDNHSLINSGGVSLVHTDRVYFARFGAIRADGANVKMLMNPTRAKSRYVNGQLVQSPRVNRDLGFKDFNRFNGNGYRNGVEINTHASHPVHGVTSMLDYHSTIGLELGDWLVVWNGSFFHVYLRNVEYTRGGTVVVQCADNLPPETDGVHVEVYEDFELDCVMGTSGDDLLTNSTANGITDDKSSSHYDPDPVFGYGNHFHVRRLLPKNAWPYRALPGYFLMSDTRIYEMRGTAPYGSVIFGEVDLSGLYQPGVPGGIARCRGWRIDMVAMQGGGTIYSYDAHNWFANPPSGPDSEFSDLSYGYVEQVGAQVAGKPTIRNKPNCTIVDFRVDKALVRPSDPTINNPFFLQEGTLYRPSLRDVNMDHSASGSATPGAIFQTGNANSKTYDLKLVDASSYNATYQVVNEAGTGLISEMTSSRTVLKNGTAIVLSNGGAIDITASTYGRKPYVNFFAGTSTGLRDGDAFLTGSGTSTNTGGGSGNGNTPTTGTGTGNTGGSTGGNTGGTGSDPNRYVVQGILQPTVGTSTNQSTTTANPSGNWQPRTSANTATGQDIALLTNSGSTFTQTTPGPLKSFTVVGAADTTKAAKCYLYVVINNQTYKNPNPDPNDPHQANDGGYLLQFAPNPNGTALDYALLTFTYPGGVQVAIDGIYLSGFENQDGSTDTVPQIHLSGFDVVKN